MKKVLYGVALALFAGVSVGSLQSCKDDINDLKSKTDFSLSDLQYKLNFEAKRLQDSIDNHTKSINEIRKNYATIAYVREKADSLERQLNNKIDTEVGKLNKEDSILASKIDGALTRLTNLKDSINPILKTYGDSIALIAGVVESQGKSIEAIQTALKNDSVALAKVGSTLDSLKNENNEIWNSLYGVGGISDQISSVYTYAQDIEKGLNATIARLDQLVTGILIQGVYSPVFGDFSLPIGVKSNLVFGWYGNNTLEDFNFPSNKSDYSATGDVDVKFVSLGIRDGFVKIPEGNYPEADTIGTVYVTLNPLGHQFNDAPVTLVNSLGEPLPFEVVLNPSKKLLTHGYTKSEISSYLYEGEVVLNPRETDDLETIEVNVDYKKLGSALKKVVKDRSTNTAINLLRTVYDELNLRLPAYALQYGWTLEESDTEFSAKSYAVLSQYDLAVATAKPLGFNSLDGVGTSKQLPILGNIENLINKIKENGSMSFKLDPITVDKITVDFGDLNIDVSGDENTGLTITIPNILVQKEGETAPQPVTLILSTLEKGANESDKAFAQRVLPADKFDANADYEYSYIEGLDGIQEGIVKGIQNALNGKDGVGDKIGKELQSQLQTQINKIIDKLNEDLGGQINDMFDNIFDQFEPYYGKINKVFNIYNKIARKVNDFLKDPAAYIQVTALYDMNGDYGFVSGKASDPTIFTQKGGNAFSLYLTSYTGELIAPAYKKFVAVTGFKENGKWYYAGDAGWDNSVNNQTYLNHVLDGNKIHIKVDATKFKAGNVYEFTYQAVDYRGATSTKKFYIEVK